MPIYFYAGFNYFDPNKIGGIWLNILDEHPMQYIYRIGRPSRTKERASRRETASLLATRAPRARQDQTPTVAGGATRRSGTAVVLGTRPRT